MCRREEALHGTSDDSERRAVKEQSIERRSAGKRF
jgi:hypothetical protein